MKLKVLYWALCIYIYVVDNCSKIILNNCEGGSQLVKKNNDVGIFVSMLFGVIVSFYLWILHDMHSYSSHPFS